MGICNCVNIDQYNYKDFNIQELPRLQRLITSNTLQNSNSSSITIEKSESNSKLNKPGNKNLYLLDNKDYYIKYKTSLYNSETHDKFISNKKYFKKNSNEINVTLLGPSGVGKSSIAIKYQSNKFETFHIVSISIEHFKKSIETDKYSYLIDFYIIPGEKEYQKNYEEIYEKTDIFVICYDATSRNSFISIDNYMAEIKKFTRKDNSDIILLGNKIDLKSLCIDVREIEKYCNEKNIDNHQISVKNETNLNTFLIKIVDNYIKCR